MTSAQPELVGDDAPVTRTAARAITRYPKSSLRLLLSRDLRWAFTWPYTWMAGVAANVVLSFGYLLVQPVTGQPRRDWAVLVGSYFAVFILADVTTTNVIGADTPRIRLHLMRGTPLGRILLSKNLVLMLVVGLPTVLATAILTVATEAGTRLVFTLPAVVFPMLSWIAAGNIVSVCLPVGYLSLRGRWDERRELLRTVRWAIAVALPYGMFVLVDPASKLPRLVTRLFSLPRNVELHGVVLLATGLLLWGVCTTVAVLIARIRKLRFDDLR